MALALTILCGFCWFYATLIRVIAEWEAQVKPRVGAWVAIGFFAPIFALMSIVRGLLVGHPTESAITFQRHVLALKGLPEMEGYPPKAT